MIPVIVRDWRWRLLLVALVGVLFFFLEPAFRPESAIDPEFADEMGPAGVSATLAYLAGTSMIILLAGFISTDRREGYARLLFSYPTSPLALYATRWVTALALSVGAAALFLILGQLVAWGQIRGGGQGLLLALLVALVFGGLMAFFSAALPRGDAWVVFLLFLPTYVPQLLSLLELGVGSGVYRTLLFLLPPQTTAIQAVYQGLVQGGPIAWAAVGYTAGYAAFWLGAAALLVKLREVT